MFSNNVSGPVGTSAIPPQTYSNSQILVMYGPNMTGAVQTTDAPYFQDLQASKRKLALNGGKPITLYTKVKQLNHITATTLNTDYAVQNPRWVSTGETGTAHFGLNVCFQKADAGMFASDSTNYQSCRIETTYYIACKGVM